MTSAAAAPALQRKGNNFKHWCDFKFLYISDNLSDSRLEVDFTFALEMNSGMYFHGIKGSADS